MRVGIDGHSASGKTSFGHELAARISNVGRLSCGRRCGKEPNERLADRTGLLEVQPPSRVQI